MPALSTLSLPVSTSSISIHTDCYSVTIWISSTDHNAAKRPYWQDITSIGSVEGSFDTKSGMATYLAAMLRYRPDLSTAHGILAFRSGFTIFKLDAFGLQRLEKSIWDSTTDL